MLSSKWGWLSKKNRTASTTICPQSKSMDSFTNAKEKWYKHADVTKPVSSGFRRGAEGCRKEGKRVARVCQLAVRHRPHPRPPITPVATSGVNHPLSPRTRIRLRGCETSGCHWSLDNRAFRPFDPSFLRAILRSTSTGAVCQKSAETKTRG